MSVTVTRARPGTHDATTATWTSPTSTTLAGTAFLKAHGNPQRYAALGLNVQTMPTLVFVPDDYELAAYSTSFILPGDTLVWQSVTYTVRDVDPVAPDGIVILAYLIVSN